MCINMEQIMINAVTVTAVTRSRQTTFRSAQDYINEMRQGVNMGSGNEILIEVADRETHYRVRICTQTFASQNSTRLDS